VGDIMKADIVLIVPQKVFHPKKMKEKVHVLLVEVK
jgi:cellobiose-specific phosphotransferase system component IIB